MKAVKYKVKISIDAVHSWGDRLIEEIFIPEIGVIINSEGFAFRSEEARGDIEIEDFHFDTNHAEFLSSYVDSLNELKNITKKLF